MASFLSLLDQLTYNLSDKAYQEALEITDSFRKLEEIDMSVYSIFDLNKKNHLYQSTKLASLLGYDASLFDENTIRKLDSYIHPEDAKLLNQAGFYFLKKLINLAPEERLKYNMFCTYRMKSRQGAYIRLFEQHHIIKNDHSGNLWLSLSIVDRAPNSSTQEVFTAFLVDKRDGHTISFNDFITLDNQKLSSRETEILHLLSIGLASKEIADQLFLSVHTVNTHRQNILRKLGAKNSLEAIKKLGIEYN